MLYDSETSIDPVRADGIFSVKQEFMLNKQSTDQRLGFAAEHHVSVDAPPAGNMKHNIDSLWCVLQTHKTLFFESHTSQAWQRPPIYVFLSFF